jgi:hypothetical protein
MFIETLISVYHTMKYIELDYYVEMSWPGAAFRILLIDNLLGPYSVKKNLRCCTKPWYFHITVFRYNYNLWNIKVIDMFMNLNIIIETYYMTR